MTTYEKKPPGRTALPVDKKRMNFATLFERDFLLRFRDWCEENKISQGRAIELVFKMGTDNFQKDIDSFH